MDSLFKGVVFWSFISVVSSELCYYYDEFDEKFRTITCYTGCCDDVCCDSYDYYWSAGSIAGAVVGSILASIFFVAIIVVLIRVCCSAGRRPSRIVYARQVNTAGCSVIQTSSSMVNNVATPQFVYPQEPKTMVPPPPPYSEVHNNMPRY